MGLASALITKMRLLLQYVGHTGTVSCSHARSFGIRQGSTVLTLMEVAPTKTGRVIPKTSKSPSALPKLMSGVTSENPNESSKVRTR